MKIDEVKAGKREDENNDKRKQRTMQATLLTEHGSKNSWEGVRMGENP